MLTRLGEQVNPALVFRGAAFNVKDLRGKQLLEHRGKPPHQVNPRFGRVDGCSDWFVNRHQRRDSSLRGLSTPGSRLES
jgi:hypothetical protein